MYNILFLALYVVSIMVSIILCDKKNKEVIITKLLGITIGYAIVFVIYFNRFVSYYVLAGLVVIIIVSTIAYILQTSSEDTEVAFIERFAKSLYNTILSFSVLVLIPLLVFYSFERLLFSVIGMAIYYIVYYVYIRVFPYKNEFCHMYFVLIVIMSLPVFLQIGLSNETQELYEYFSVEDKISTKIPESEFIMELEDLETEFISDNDIKLLISDGKFYSVSNVDGSSGNDVKGRLQVYDMETSSCEFDGSFPTSGNYVLLRENYGNGIYEINGSIVIALDEEIFLYKDGFLSLIHKGGLAFIERDDMLYFFEKLYSTDEETNERYSYYQLYRYDGTFITEDDRFEVLDELTIYSINNHFYQKEYYRKENNYYIEGGVYTVEDLFFITDDNILFGDYNAAFYIDEDGDYLETNSDIYTDSIKVGDLYYKYWKAGIIINNLPKPILFVYDEDFKVITVMEGTGDLSNIKLIQADDGIYYHGVSEESNRRALYKLDFVKGTRSNLVETYMDWMMARKTYRAIFILAVFRIDLRSKKKKK